MINLFLILLQKGTWGGIIFSFHADMAEWQTRTLEGRVGLPRAGSSPVIRTINNKRKPVGFLLLFIDANAWA